MIFSGCLSKLFVRLGKNLAITFHFYNIPNAPSNISCSLAKKQYRNLNHIRG